MFCQNKTSYLEVGLNSCNVSDLLAFSPFCHRSILFIKYASIPFGLIIMMLTTSAFTALKSRFRMSSNGTGIIFMAVLALDFINGILCFRLFEQTAIQKRFVFHSDLAAEILEWITWLTIFTSWMLKFFLCLYKIHRYLQANISIWWYPGSNYNDPSPLTKRQGAIVVAVSCAISLCELAVMYIAKDLDKENPGNTVAVVIPFLGIQNLLQWICSLAVAAIYVFTRSSGATRLEKFVTSTIGISCMFTILANSCLAYGDFSCMFHYKTPWQMSPTCYSLLARFLGYTDSMFFSLIQFRSTAVRGYFLSALRGGDRPYHTSTGTSNSNPTTEDDDEDMLSSYPILGNSRNNANFRSVIINDSLPTVHAY